MVESRCGPVCIHIKPKNGHCGPFRHNYIVFYNSKAVLMWRAEFRGQCRGSLALVKEALRSCCAQPTFAKAHEGAPIAN